MATVPKSVLLHLLATQPVRLHLYGSESPLSEFNCVGYYPVLLGNWQFSELGMATKAEFNLRGPLAKGPLGWFVELDGMILGKESFLTPIDPKRPEIIIECDVVLS